MFAVTDVMAMGALARLRAGGLQVPADIALAGFDDIGTLRDVYPPLTTVRLPLKRMGEMAAGLVLADPPGAAGHGPRAASRGSSPFPARSSCARAPARTRRPAERPSRLGPAPAAAIDLLRAGGASGTLRTNWKALARTVP